MSEKIMGRPVAHGGAKAEKQLRRGEPLTGLAAMAEREAAAELQAEGRAAMVTKGAVRLQAVAQLYWGAVQTASDEGDIDRLTTYVKVYGWLQSLALRALAQLRDEQKDNPQDLIIDAIHSAKEARANENHESD